MHCNVCNVFQSPLALSSHFSKSTISFSPSFIKYNRFIKNYKLEKQELEWNHISPSVHLKTNHTHFTLKSFHIHQPGEHSLNHKKYNLELHFVFASDSNSNDLLVLGFLAKEVLFPQESSKIFARLIKNKKFKIPNFLKTSFWRYTGSLTGEENPSTENVNWIVSNKILNITREQLEILFHLSRPSKPLQDRAGREISFHFNTAKKQKQTTNQRNQM